MLLVTLAVLARLASPMSMAQTSVAALPEQDVLAALFAEGAICHAFGEPDAVPKPGQPAPHHTHDCGLCPACHVTNAPALPVMSGTAPPSPAVAVRVVVELPPPATGPPSSAWTPSRPRGPPELRV